MVIYAVDLSFTVEHASGNTLLWKVYMCSTEVKLTLLKTFCSPMHTAQLWRNYTVASIHKLYVAYNDVFRLWPCLCGFGDTSSMLNKLHTWHIT